MTARVAARNPTARGASAAVVGLCAALAAACGADASEPGEDGVEPPSPVLQAADAPSLLDASASERQASIASASLPSTSPLDELPPQPEPAPLPSSELQTTLPVGSSVPVDVVVPPGDCRFEYLGEWVRCENAGWPHVLATDATDLLSCMQQCLAREDCTAVTDYLWLGQAELGCYLYLSSCDEPALEADWGEEDGGRDFRRACADER